MRQFRLFINERIKLLALILCLAASVPQLMAQTYTVAGTPSSVLGTEWDPSNTSNDMVRMGSTTYYYLAKTANVNSGSYAFKVTLNHGWGTAYPSNNYNYSVGSSGTQSIVYIFNTSGNAVSVFGPFKTLTVAGSQTELLGSSWGQTDANNDMTTTDGVNYTLSFTDVNVTQGSYQLKVVQDHAWTYAWPGSNYNYSIGFTGTADVVFSFNVVTKEVNVTVTEKSVIPVTPTYYITGDNGLGLGGFKYNPTTTMTDEGNGIYTYSYNVTTAGNYYFAFGDGQGSDWNDFNGNHRIGPTSGNVEVSLDGSWVDTQKGSGAYFVNVDAGPVTITLDVTNMRFNVVGTAPSAPVDYYVVGADTNIFPNGWNNGSETLMTENNGTYTWTASNVHLEKGTTYQFKVHGSDDSWHPSSNNATFTVDDSGSYNVVFTFDGTNVNAVPSLIQADPVYTYDIYVRYTGSEPASNVFLYAWDAASTLSAAWSGTALSSLTSQVINGHTYYHVTYTSYFSTINVIFNENGTSQTADLTAEPGDNYFTYGGGNTVDGPNDQADAPTVYYVVGADEDIFPNGWDSGSETLMANDNGTYTWIASDVHLDAGTSYTYRVLDSDGSWHPANEDATFSVDANGTYNVVFTFDGTNVTAVPSLIQADPVYTYDIYVRYTGSEPVSNVFIYAWDAVGDLSAAWSGTALSSLTTHEINDFTYYKVTYTSYYSNITVIFNENGTSQTANLTTLPGDNYFTYGGGSDVVGPSSHADEPDFFVVGEETAIFPNGWDISSETLMTEDNGTYTWTASNVHLEANTDYQYKVHGSNGSWYPEGSDNASFSVDARGTYNVVFTFDGTNVTAVPTLVQADQVYTYDIYVRYKGNEPISNVYLYAWDNEGELSAPWSGTALSGLTSQVINGHTYYHVTYTSYSSTINVIFNENGSSQTANLTAEPGDNYYTYGGGTTVDGPNDAADAAIAYYVVGDDTSIFPNGWEMGNGTMLTDNGDGTYSWTASNVHLDQSVDYEYKVRDNEGNWYPDGDNQKFSVNVPGTYNVTVTIDSNTGAVTVNVTLIAADPISHVYVVGNAGTQQWAANAGIAMEYNSETGYYVLENVVLTAMSHFGFATVLGSNSEDWATLNANRLSPDNNDHVAITEALLGEWMNTRDYVNNTYNWYVEQSGAYDIFFNPVNRQVMVKKSHQTLYMSYGVEWSYENNSVEMTSVDGNIYQTTVTLNTGDYFLFSTALSDATALGAVDPGYEISDLMIGFAQKLESNTNNFHFTGTTGKYIVVVNLEKGTVTLRKTADATVTKIFLQKTSNVTLNPAGGTYNGQTLEGKRGGIYAWNKLNLKNAGDTYLMAQDGPTNYTYEGELMNGNEPYGGNGYLKDLPDTTTVDGKEWYAWSVSNSICEFYFIRTNKTDLKSQKVMRRSGEVWLIWQDEDATEDRQDDYQHNDKLQDVTALYYDVTASGVSDCSTMLEDHYYVYYTNTTGWDSVYCYAWYEGEPVIEFTGAYPGKKCTFVGYDEDGYEVWCYDFGLMEDFHRIWGKDENDEYVVPSNVIFDNGLNEDHTRQQTGDLVFDNGACYDYLGMVYLGNSLNGIINSGIVNGPKYTVEDNLIGVYYDESAITKILETDMAGNPILDAEGNRQYITVRGALYAKDFEKYSAKSVRPDGTTDYVYETCAHPKTANYPGGSQIQIKRDYYDQSNWVKIVLSPNFDNGHLQNTDVTYNKELFDDKNFESATQGENPYLQQYVGKVIPGGSMSGNLVSKINPQMHITNIAMPLPVTKYEPNVYVTSHFNDSVVFSYVHQDWSPGIYDGVYRTVPVWKTNEETQETFVDHMRIDSEPTKMFYVAPKPQEVAYITWAVFVHDDPEHIIGTAACREEPDTPGEFHAPMNWDRTGQLWDGTNPQDTTEGGVPYGTTYGPYSNGYMQYAAFQVNWSLFEGMEFTDPYARPQKPWYQIFKPGQAYKILAVIRYAHGDKPDEIEYVPGVYKDNDYDDEIEQHIANAPRRADGEDNHWPDMQGTPYGTEEWSLKDSKFIVFPLKGSSGDSDGDGVGNVTAVKEIKYVHTDKDIVSVRYYDITGRASETPFDGINIVVTTYNDGSRTSKKIMR